MTADYHLPWNIAVEPDPIVSARITELTADIQPILGQQVGVAAEPILRSDNCGGETGRLCESLIGNVITDAMRLSYDADFAITNSGGIRADLTCPLEASTDDVCDDDLPPNAITRRQVLGVLPFGNVAVTVDLNGVELVGFRHQPLILEPGQRAVDSGAIDRRKPGMNVPCRHLRRDVPSEFADRPQHELRCQPFAACPQMLKIAVVWTQPLLRLESS